ncbi:hypothetical protein AVEN_78069-1 [Araneus ventricosus]|uniref:Uncharacterized protein n=1 Tax=Araneus ventricosus TaxID=182803 RepID=A0A4Y2F787_ARAVE|nr:hypothetical protein AVEN_78069-1 [Araneus ventricosus]
MANKSQFPASVANILSGEGMPRILMKACSQRKWLRANDDHQSPKDPVTHSKKTGRDTLLLAGNCTAGDAFIVDEEYKEKYCSGQKIRPPDSDESPRFIPTSS